MCVALCLVFPASRHAECRVSVDNAGVVCPLFSYFRRRVPLHHHRTCGQDFGPQNVYYNESIWHCQLSQYTRAQPDHGVQYWGGAKCSWWATVQSVTPKMSWVFDSHSNYNKFLRSFVTLGGGTLQSPEPKYGTVCQLTYDYIRSHCRHSGRYENVVCHERYSIHAV